MKKIFFVALLCSLIQNMEAIIVFLKGAGCAGKTSICKELLQSDPSWKVVDEDALYIEKANQYFKDAFSEEFQHIENAIAFENIFHAIKRNQILFKNTATIQQKRDARIAVYSIRTKLDEYTASNRAISREWHEKLAAYILDCIKTYVHQGFNVIVDSWMFKKEQIEMLEKEYAVVQVLAYCPLQDLINRTIRRNSDALVNRNLYGMRYYHQALMSFIDLYDFEENKSDQAIDIITREELNNALDVVELSLSIQENGGGYLNCFSRAEFSRSQFQEYRLNFMKKFMSQDTLYIVPKNKIDICIRTDNADPLSNAQQLLNAISSITSKYCVSQCENNMDNKVTITELKEQVKKFVEARDWQQFHCPKNVSMGLSIEASELMEIFLYGDEQDSYKRVVEKRQDVEDEIADVLHWVLIFAYRNNIDLSTALSNKLEKNAKKYPVEKAKGSAKKYTEL